MLCAKLFPQLQTADRNFCAKFHSKDSNPAYFSLQESTYTTTAMVLLASIHREPEPEHVWSFADGSFNKRPTIHFFLWSARQKLEALVSQRALYTGPQRLPNGGREVAYKGPLVRA